MDGTSACLERRIQPEPYNIIRDFVTTESKALESQSDQSRCGALLLTTAPPITSAPSAFPLNTSLSGLASPLNRAQIQAVAQEEAFGDSAFPAASALVQTLSTAQVNSSLQLNLAVGSPTLNPSISQDRPFARRCPTAPPLCTFSTPLIAELLIGRGSASSSRNLTSTPDPHQITTSTISTAAAAFPQLLPTSEQRRVLAAQGTNPVTGGNRKGPTPSRRSIDNSQLFEESVFGVDSCEVGSAVSERSVQHPFTSAVFSGEPPYAPQLHQQRSVGQPLLRIHKSPLSPHLGQEQSQLQERLQVSSQRTQQKRVQQQQQQQVVKQQQPLQQLAVEYGVYPTPFSALSASSAASAAATREGGPWLALPPLAPSGGSIGSIGSSSGCSGWPRAASPLSSRSSRASVLVPYTVLHTKPNDR